MSSRLAGKKIAFLVTDNFEQGELTKPQEALEKNGAATHIIAPVAPVVKGSHFGEPGDEFPVDVPLDEADPDVYDALVLPGGIDSVSNLRLDERAVGFVKSFFEAGKLVTAICHAPWLLIEAGVLTGRRLTSAEDIQTDIRNAGGEWVDERIVVDNQLLTSGKPGDLVKLNEKLVEKVAETG